MATDDLQARLAQYPVSERGVDDLHDLLRRLEAQGAHEDEILAARRLLAVCEALYGERHRETSVAHNLLGAAARKAGRWPEAAEHYEWTAGYLRQHPVPGANATVCAYWAFCLHKLGDAAGARAAIDEAVTHAETAEDRFALRARAIDYAVDDDAHKLQRARALFEEVCAADRLTTRQGSDVADVLIDLLLANDDPEAITVQQRMVAAARRAVEGGHRAPLWLEEQNLATVHARVGDRDVAQRLFRSVLSKLRAELGDDHPHTQLTRRNMAQHGFDEPADDEADDVDGWIDERPFLFARCFLSRTKKLEQIVGRLRDASPFAALSASVQEAVAELRAPGLLIRLTWTDRLRAVMAEAAQLPRDEDKARARRYPAVIRVEVQRGARYRGAVMRVFGAPFAAAWAPVAVAQLGPAADMTRPGVPNEALVLCEQLHGAESAAVYDAVLQRWLGD